MSGLERLRNDQNGQQPASNAQTAHVANELVASIMAEVNQTLANKSAEWKLRCEQKARDKARMEKEAMAAKIEKLKLEAEISRMAKEAKQLQDSIDQNYAAADQTVSALTTRLNAREDPAPGRGTADLQPPLQVAPAQETLPEAPVNELEVQQDPADPSIDERRRSGRLNPLPANEAGNLQEPEGPMDRPLDPLDMIMDQTIRAGNRIARGGAAVRSEFGMMRQVIQNRDGTTSGPGRGRGGRGSRGGAGSSVGAQDAVSSGARGARGAPRARGTPRAPRATNGRRGARAATPFRAMEGADMELEQAEHQDEPIAEQIAEEQVAEPIVGQLAEQVADQRLVNVKAEKVEKPVVNRIPIVDDDGQDLQLEDPLALEATDGNEDVGDNGEVIGVVPANADDQLQIVMDQNQVVQGLQIVEAQTDVEDEDNDPEYQEEQSEDSDYSPGPSSSRSRKRRQETTEKEKAKKMKDAENRASRAAARDGSKGDRQ